MKTDQKGFSAVEAILIFVILGIIGGTGWYVWHATQKTDEILQPDNSSLQQADKASASSQPVFKPLPAGFSEYKLADFGLRFGYPTAAGAMADARKGDVLFAATTPEAYNAQNKWKGSFSLNVLSKTDFSFTTAKYGATIKPASGKWIVTALNPAVTDYKVGDTYKMPEKKINGGVAYQFTDNEEGYPTTRWLIELDKGYAIVALPRLAPETIADDLKTWDRQAYTQLEQDVLASFTKF